MAKEKAVRTIAKDIKDLSHSINKEYGDGSLMVGHSSIVNVEVFPTNIITLDIALGCRGIPCGRILELFGPESSGKTTLSFHLVAACQKHFFSTKKRNGTAAFIDAEHALDPSWAKKLGVNMDKLLISQPESGEEAFDILERMAESSLVDLIIVDSVAALMPKSMIDGNIADTTIGEHARLMSKGMNKIKGKCNETKTTVVFINQIREKIGVMFGNPETTTGGRALKFYATIRMEIRRGSAIKEDDITVGFETNLKVIKNKVAPPFTSARFDICFGTKELPIYGIDQAGALIKLAIDTKVLERKGSWYNYKELRLGLGVVQASNFLRSNSTVYKEIETETLKQLSTAQITETQVENTEDIVVVDED